MLSAPRSARRGVEIRGAEKRFRPLARSFPPPVESNKHYFTDTTQFNESWFDKVVERKLAMRDLVPLGDKFTSSRMPSVPVMR